MTRIAILDYGMGNLRSVEKAFERAGVTAVITADHNELRSADGLVLPGVGAFPKAIENIRKLEFDSLLAELLDDGVPTLGICLGLQLIFESSEELGGGWGLGFLQGGVERLGGGGVKVPHIGWNAVKWQKQSRLTEGIPDGRPFYFVHSFAPKVAESDDVLGTSEYGGEFVCAVERGPLYAIQFHPEKSSTDGIRLLKNFASICAAVKGERAAA